MSIRISNLKKRAGEFKPIDARHIARLLKDFAMVVRRIPQVVEKRN